MVSDSLERLKQIVDLAVHIANGDSSEGGLLESRYGRIARELRYTAEENMRIAMAGMCGTCTTFLCETQFFANGRAGQKGRASFPTR